ncbi:MAG TPA: hypothetical protein DCY45_06110 [Mesotoga sp.]|nr:hypothetical protein [Mesotoga sp.]
MIATPRPNKSLDPAVASSPLITTVVDATGLFIYFSVATLLL